MDDLIQHANAIVVTTPPHTHADLIRKSLRPGKIVLCEKPFTTSYRDAVDLANEATSTGALLYVGHFRRNFPQVQLARSLVELGVVGEITDMFVSEGGRFTWKAVSDYIIRDEHGGVLWDTGSHALDMALFASCLDGWPDCDVKVPRG